MTWPHNLLPHIPLHHGLPVGHLPQMGPRTPPSLPPTLPGCPWSPAPSALCSPAQEPLPRSPPPVASQAAPSPEATAKPSAPRIAGPEAARGSLAVSLANASPRLLPAGSWAQTPGQQGRHPAPGPQPWEWGDSQYWGRPALLLTNQETEAGGRPGFL